VSVTRAVPNIATQLPRRASQTRTPGVRGGVDRSRRLAVVACKHVSTNRKCDDWLDTWLDTWLDAWLDTWLGMTTPLRNRHNIHTPLDDEARMRVPGL
jgi:hypothetical protein